MATNNSDYKKPRSKVLDHLPEVFQSSTNAALYGNTADRFMTKDETVVVSGYVGEGNKRSIIDKQIREETPHLQAYQLKPVIHTKIGTVDHTATFEDINKQLTLLGVDPNLLDQWADCDTYVWAPPIDIDKFTNYYDYYWDDPSRTSPQYIAIENRCNRARDKYRSYLSLLNSFTGFEFDPVTLTPDPNNDPSLTLLDIITFGVNSLTVYGDFSRLFVSGFQFIIANSSTTSINGMFWTTLNSAYNSQNDVTTIVVVEPMGTVVGPADGVIDLGSQLDSFQTAMNCICDGESEGFDSTLFDDYLSSGTIPTSPPVSPVKYDTWHDATQFILYQHDGTQWVVVNPDTRIIDGQIRNDVVFDGSPQCTQEQDLWSVQNKWSHKTSIINSGARQATLPIIEYKSNLEVNSWVEYVHDWKYRRSHSESFVATNSVPTLFELTPVEMFTVGVGGLSFELSPLYGDLRESLSVGSSFRMNDGTTIQTFTVQSIDYQKAPSSSYYRTVIFVNETIVSPVSSNPHLSPDRTSRGEYWRGYYEHWLYVGVSGVRPIHHQELSPYLVVPDSTPRSSYISGDGQSRYDYYVGLDKQEFVSISTATRTLTLATSSPARFSVAQRSVYGADQVRVYFNGIRQYGNYDEVPTTLEIAPVDSGDPLKYNPNSTDPHRRIPHVAGVQFLAPIPSNTTVTIEVGPNSLSDIGRETVAVRTDESDQFHLVVVSLLRYKQSEQIKRFVNQNPLFDVYSVDGSYYGVSPIFSYKESELGTVEPLLGKRIIRNESSGFDAEFQLFLIDDKQRMLAYRDLNDVPEYWVNVESGSVWIWNDDHWNDVYYQGDYIRYPYYQAIAPTIPPATPTFVTDGILWFDSSTNVLNRWNQQDDVWVPQSIVIQNNDPSLHTVWKKSQHFVPGFVDSERYSVPQDLLGFAVCYNDGDTRMYLQYYENGTLSWTNDITSALRYETRIRADVAKNAALSVDNSRALRVVWVESDWELPDQMLFNPLHEYRTQVSYVQVFSHFKSLIDSQPHVPGTFTGNSLFAVNQNDVDYSKGGLIKEHSDSFDLMVSGIFCESSTPTDIVDFAHDRYVGSVLFLKEYYQKNTTMLLDTSTAALYDLTAHVTNVLTQQHETNENNQLVFVDSTSYDPVTELGIENWIATLPNFGFVDRVNPVRLFDSKLLIDEIRHHDGHIASYAFAPSFTNLLLYKLIQVKDTRVAPPRPIGVRGPLVNRPSTVAEFEQTFGPLRSGVLWNSLVLGETVLYKFNVAFFTGNTPSSTLPDGTLWFDIATDTLRVKQGALWNPTTGFVGDSDITAGWSLVEFGAMFNEAVYQLEQQLYQVVPHYAQLQVDYEEVRLQNPSTYAQYEKEAFIDYTKDQGILDPYSQSGTYSQTDPFTWNYSYSPLGQYPYSPVVTTIRGGCWQDLYQKLYGTPYPHMEPWILQGFAEKPVWWDDEYKDDTNTRRWKPVMWTNVLSGTIPVQYQIVGQIVRSYQFVSVNVDSVAVTCGSVTYNPDDLLPPYFPVASCMGPLYTGPVQSVYTLFTQVVSPSSDFAYGDIGTVEWKWHQSSKYFYDRLNVVFRLQPIRFYNWTFGNQKITIGDIDVDVRTGRVPSIVDTIFHGTLLSVNNIYRVYGLNQWYVNYNRYHGIDTNGDFNTMWSRWLPQLSYQFSSMVDTTGLEVTNRYFDVSKDHDYSVVVSHHPYLGDARIHGFTLSAINVPPKLNYAHIDDSEWKFLIDTITSTSVPIKAYGVQLYPVMVDPLTSVLSVGKYAIVGSNVSSRTFVTNGNDTEVILAGDLITVTGSSSNDGGFTVVSSAYDPVNDRTTVVVAEPIVSSVVLGYLTTNKSSISWETGDEVWVSSTDTLPRISDLFNNLPATIVMDRTLPYFVIREIDAAGTISPNQFRLANTRKSAYSRTPIGFVDGGQGQVSVGKVKTSFYALNRQNTTRVWNHYELDTSQLVTYTFPKQHYGIQTIVNIIDGYAAYVMSQGFVFNDITDQDVNGRMFDWQYELEKFIDWAFALRLSFHSRGKDRFPIVVDSLTGGTFRFTSSVPAWSVGQDVSIMSIGSVPAPFTSRVVYYYIPGSNNTFKLALSALDATNGVGLPITSLGTGQITIQQPEDMRDLPQTEINPVRYLVTYSPSLGIVSDVIHGPYSDIRTDLAVYDYQNNPVNSNDLFVERSDLYTIIRLQRGIANPYNDVTKATLDELHMGGAHLITQGFEHIIVFNNLTVGGDLVFDPFLGLHTAKFDLLFRRTPVRNMRPNIGGYVIHNKNELMRNIEGSVDDLRYVYSAVIPDEQSTLTKYSRNTLGYTGRSSYLDEIFINPKSQFLFWRGMIQQKGSVSSVNAYINSRRFTDAMIDEYWAYKVGEFGSDTPPIYPQIQLSLKDSVRSDIRFEFVSLLDVDQDVTPGFENITLSADDEYRWFQYPDQKAALAHDTNLFFDAWLADKHTVYFGQTAVPGLSNESTLWFDTLNSTTNQWIGNQWSTSVTYDSMLLSAPTIGGSNESIFLTFAFPCDDLLVYARRTNLSPELDVYDTIQFVEGRDYTKINDNIYRFKRFEDTAVVPHDPIEECRPHSTMIPEFLLPFTYQPNTNSVLMFLNGYSQNNLALEERFNTQRFVLDPIDAISQTFYVKGDVRQYFIANADFIVDTANPLLSEYPFTVSSAFFNGTRTGIIVKEPISIFIPPSQESTTLWDRVVVSDAEIVINVATLDNFIEKSSDSITYQSSLNLTDKVEFIHINTSAPNPPPFHRQVVRTKAGDTTIQLDWNYRVGTPSLLVFVDGVKQIVNRDYVEYGAKGIQFSELFADGQLVDVIDLTIDDVASPAQIVGDSRVYDVTQSQSVFVLPWFYSDASQTLLVFVDGLKKTIDVDYTTSATDVTFVVPQLPGSVVEVINVYEVTIEQGIKNGDIIDFYTVVPNYKQMSPLKMIDTQSNPETVVATIPAWDPARGQHDVNGIHVVDLQTNKDPALYSTAVVGEDPEHSWREHHVGTTWLDTNTLGYIPYHDDSIFPNVQDRLDRWGDLAPWSTVNVYRWIETSLAPEDWADNSLNGDGSVTGLPKQSLYRKERVPFRVTLDVLQDGTTTFTLEEENDWQVGTQLLFSTLITDEELPDGLFSGVYYTIVNRISSTIFQVNESYSNTDVPLSLTTQMSIKIKGVRPFADFSWEKEQFVHQRFYVATIARPSEIVSNITLKLDANLFRGTKEFAAGDIVDVYVNGELVQEQVEVPSNEEIVVIAPERFLNNEIIDVVRPLHLVTTDEQAFDPDLDDDGTVVVQWFNDYDHTVTYTDNGTFYYYWVQSTTDTPDNRLSIAGAAASITRTPSPYVVFQKHQHPVPTSFDKKIRVVPFRYRQSIVRGIAGFITQDDRFVLRYTKDLTLRDTAENVQSSLALKTSHTQWEMFRQLQMFHISRTLWDKITESLVQHKLNDDSIRVPSLEREAYDVAHQTETKYGLGEGQAFVDRNLAIVTIVADLENPDNDFSPIDINEFLRVNTFDLNDSEGVVTTMNLIYSTFSNIHVNRIFFNVLRDALSTKTKYPDLMKTSMVALHGIRVLDVNGINDD